MTERGRIIATEGGDGAGKETQTNMLFSYVTTELGRNALKEHYPRYEQDSSDIVRHYLAGEYGELDAIPPELIADAYAIDRRAGTYETEAFLEEDPSNLVLFDRYVASNAAYQGAKKENYRERTAFYEWLFRREYQDLRIPRPDQNLLLLVPPDVSVQSVIDRGNGQDLHESNLEYLWRVSNAYHELSQLYPDDFTPIDCMTIEGKMRSREAIQNDIRKALGI